MVSDYLLKPLRHEEDVLLKQFQDSLDAAAAAAKGIADKIERRLPSTTRNAVLVEWRQVASMLGNPRDALHHDHIIPALELLRDVYGEGE